MAIRRILTNVASTKVAFGSVGAGYGNLLAGVTGTGVIVMIVNTLNQEVTISLDGGTTDWMFLPVGFSPTIDLGANEGQFSGTISVKHSGVAPTAGFIAASVIRVQ